MGADDSYETFVRLHADALFTTAYMLTGNASEAEELLQDTLVRLYPKWSRVMAADLPLAYVRRSIANAFVSSRLRPATRELLTPNPPERSAGPDPAVAVTDRDQLWQLLASLSHRQRAALVLRYLYDVPDEDIAAALGCRTATVRSLTSRGAATLGASYARVEAADGTTIRVSSQRVPAMTELRAYEDELREDLRSAAASVQPPEGLAERLVAGTSPSGRETAWRRTRPRWVGRWALPALAASTVVAVVATTVVVQAHVHSHVHAPSTTPATPVGVVPWKSLPRPGTSNAVTPPPRVAAPTGTRQCAAADFVVDSVRSGPDAFITGWVQTHYLLRSTAPLPCTVSVEGQEAVLLDASGHALPNDAVGRGGPYMGPDPLVRPGQLLSATVTWAVYAGRAPRPTRLLLLPSGSATTPESNLSISLAGVEVPPRPVSGSNDGAWRAGVNRGVRPSVNDPGSLGSLDAVARVPKEVQVGQVLTYQVDLINHTSIPVHLDPCPEFTQDLATITFAAIKTFHEASFRGLLNCDAAPKVIAAHSSVSFTMQLGTGGNVAGDGQLDWTLVSGGYAVTTVFAHVRVVL